MSELRSLSVTSDASKILRKLSALNGHMAMLLDDQGCCGYSNVFLTDRPPERASDQWKALGHIEGIPVYANVKFEKYLGSNITVDVVESPADDSFSLETSLGVRLITVIQIVPTVLGLER